MGSGRHPFYSQQMSKNNQLISKVIVADCIIPSPCACSREVNFAGRTLFLIGPSLLSLNVPSGRAGQIRMLQNFPTFPVNITTYSD